jgi:hypothetical protein
MRVLVCGYPKWRDAAAIHDRLAGVPPDTVVLHPDPAAAMLGALVAGIAQVLGLAHEPVSTVDGTLPDCVDRVLAFHAYLPGSRHTKALVDAAERCGVPVDVIGSTGSHGGRKPARRIGGIPPLFRPWASSSLSDGPHDG